MSAIISTKHVTRARVSTRANPELNERMPKLLLVGADASQRALLKDLLKESGADWPVDYAPTCDDARRALGLGPGQSPLPSFEYRLVSYDALLLADGSQADGLDLIRQLRRIGLDTAVVVLLARPDEQVALAALRAGATDCLPLAEMSPSAISRAICQATTLRDREQQFRAVFDHALDAIIVFDEERRFVDVNPAACSLYEVSREELLRLRLDDTVPPEALQELADNCAALRLHGQLKGEGRIVTRSGGKRVMEYTVRADVLPGRHMAILRDVTDRRRLEEQLRQAQKMETVGRLAGGIAHDFNNLLTAIVGYSNLLLEQVAPDAPMREDLEEIKRAGDRAATLTQQLLAFSRKQVLQPVVLSMNEVVTGMEKILRRLLAEHIELVIVPSASASRVKVDPSQIEQVILNLAVNARDAMPNGGRLTIEMGEAYLPADYRDETFAIAPGRYVLLAVNDTGIGMSESVRSRIFEPFFTTKPHSKGTGLGLATVYGIVKQSGGYIWVRSEPDKGTTFEIFLPQAESDVESAEPSAAASGTSPRGSETVLLVEDEAAVRALARATLERHGYHVLEAQNGVDAVAVAERHDGLIDLLLTDVVMPGLSGRELVGRLMPLRPTMRVVYMSGYSDDAIAHHGVLDPGTAFFQKPFTPRALAQVVRDVLDLPRTS